jgi:hypothetical protein
MQLVPDSTRIVWSRILSLLAIATVVLFAVPSASAQFDSGAVNGQVSDPGGAAVVGANVTLHNVELGTDLSRKTNSQGQYEFPDVQAGSYTVKVEAAGFAESVTRPFDVTISAKQQIDVPLSVGGGELEHHGDGGQCRIADRVW